MGDHVKSDAEIKTVLEKELAVAFDSGEDYLVAFLHGIITGISLLGRKSVDEFLDEMKKGTFDE